MYLSLFYGYYFEALKIVLLIQTTQLCYHFFSMDLTFILICCCVVGWANSTDTLPSFSILYIHFPSTTSCFRYNTSCYGFHPTNALDRKNPSLLFGHQVSSFSSNNLCCCCCSPDRLSAISECRKLSIDEFYVAQKRLSTYSAKHSVGNLLACYLICWLVS